MARKRTLPPIVKAPTHSGMADCHLMTETGIHTVTLPEGSFAAIAMSNPTTGKASIAILDRDEVEKHIELLRNAIEDAELADQGKPMRHAPGLPGRAH